MTQLRRDGSGNSEAHAGKSVRHEECSGLVAAPELAHEEFVRTDVAGSDPIAGKDRPELFDETQRGEPGPCLSCGKLRAPMLRRRIQAGNQRTKIADRFERTVAAL